MQAAEFAATLAGAQYPFRLTPEQAATAKAHGLVVVYGASDDLMEFEGAIYDELGAYNGTVALVDATGLLPAREQIEDDDELRDYFSRQPRTASIEALWDSEGYSWTYRTTIPHATFEVMEDGEPYCRGIVFALADVQPGGAA
ncbi:MAG TPA: hypothetical protein VFE72_04975 [Lysobacter sp.]|nr:hypothetical protein [Lysobacter sp.]